MRSHPAGRFRWSWAVDKRVFPSFLSWSAHFLWVPAWLRCRCSLSGRTWSGWTSGRGSGRSRVPRTGRRCRQGGELRTSGGSRRCKVRFPGGYTGRSEEGSHPAPGSHGPDGVWNRRKDPESGCHSLWRYQERSLTDRYSIPTGSARE